MEILETIQYLDTERADELLGKSTEGFEGGHQRPILGILEHDVDVILGTDKAKIMDDVHVSEGFEQTDFFLLYAYVSG